MKFGVREICDVVLKAKATQKVGNKVFYKNEPVIYFDTLKTSSLEGAATTVYAQGGRGNSRLVAWEGERTVTFTMEDALISPAGFMILSGAGLIEGTEADPIPVHTIETTDQFKYTDDNTAVEIYVKEKPYVATVTTGENDGAVTTAVGKEDFVYVMTMVNGEIVSEPFVPARSWIPAETAETTGTYKGLWKITIPVNGVTEATDNGVTTPPQGLDTLNSDKPKNQLGYFDGIDAVVVDYYTAKGKGAMQIDITPDKFGGNYYLEASTLFRNTDGVDLPAEFIIPNCKIQSNFTFTMASSGDPSTFTFTIDAFPDYTRFNKTKKVLAAIQIIDVASGAGLENRVRSTPDELAANAEPYREKTNTGWQPIE